MKRTFKLSKIILAGGLLFLTHQVIASDFNLPFYNASELGNLYSGWAASATDASTLYSNPAGLVRIQHQQFVGSALGISGSSRFNGSALTPPYPFPFPIAQSGGASTKLRGFLPSIYYAIPINPNIVFGIGETSPFALGTNYRGDSIVRFAALRTQIVVTDFTPSIGVRLSNNVSVGLGLDADRMAFAINYMYGPPVSLPFFSGVQLQNHLTGWGYGWHAGILYQALPCTRIGLSINSNVMFHTSGDSEVFTSLGRLKINSQHSYAALPARTQLSIHQDINPQLAIMATAFYTNWRTLDKITLQSTMTPNGSVRSVTIPLLYHNTFDYSVGLNYKPHPQWILRTGVEYLNTPSNNQTRSVADPIGAATIVGIGAHYQQNRCIGYDVSYAHGFFKDTSINLVTPLTSLRGHSSQNTNVLGGQITWDII